MPVFPQPASGLVAQAANIYSNTSTVTSVAQVTNSNDVVIYNVGTAGQTLTLPAVTLGGIVRVINIHATGTVIVSPKEASGVTVAGGATYTVPAGATGAGSTGATFFSDGANWWV